MKQSLFFFLADFPELVIALSTKKDHSMKINRELVNDTVALSHRDAFSVSQGVSPELVVSAKLEHTNTVAIVNESHSGTFIDHVDGLITDSKNVFLSVTVADCLPIFIYDPKKKIVSLLHAGWRGLASNIIGVSLDRLKSDFSSDPNELIVGIGPGIDQCHFSVTEGIIEKFSQYPEMIAEKNFVYFLNLKEIARKQLIDKGISIDHIEISPLCTYCENKTYFSYRRDKPEILETMMVIMGIKE